MLQGEMDLKGKRKAVTCSRRRAAVGSLSQISTLRITHQSKSSKMLFFPPQERELDYLKIKWRKPSCQTHNAHTQEQILFIEIWHSRNIPLEVLLEIQKVHLAPSSTTCPRSFQSHEHTETRQQFEASPPGFHSSGYKLSLNTSHITTALFSLLSYKANKRPSCFLPLATKGKNNWDKRWLWKTEWLSAPQQQGAVLPILLLVLKSCSAAAIHHIQLQQHKA